MKIKNQKAKHNIIDQLREDVERLGLDSEFSLSSNNDHYSLSELTPLEPTPEKTQNTSVTIDYINTAQSPKTVILKYHRLDLEIIVDKLGSHLVQKDRDIPTLIVEPDYPVYTVEADGIDEQRLLEEISNKLEIYDPNSLSVVKQEMDPDTLRTDYLVTAKNDSLLVVGSVKANVSLVTADAYTYITTDSGKFYIVENTDANNGEFIKINNRLKEIGETISSFYTKEVNISNDLFKDFTALNSVEYLNLPFTKTIGYRAFKDALGSVEVIRFSDNLTSISDEAFVGATFNDTVPLELPDSIKTLGRHSLGNVALVRTSSPKTIIHAIESEASSNPNVKYITEDEEELATMSVSKFFVKGSNVSFFHVVDGLFDSKAAPVAKESITKHITKAEISKKVASIPNNVLKKINVEELDLEHVVNIGENSFSGATITKLKLTSNLAEVNETAFSNATINTIVVNNEETKTRLKALTPFSSESINWEVTNKEAPESAIPITDEEPPVVKVIESTGLEYGGAVYASL